jgi:hypothetical protein
MQSIKQASPRSKKILIQEDPHTLATTTKSSDSRTAKRIPLAIHRPRLLLACDCSERLQKLEGLVRNLGFEITCTGTFDELLHACSGSYEVIALDVAPAQLEPMLKLIRSNEQTSGILVLDEVSQINNDLNLVGVLPHYRAMPCNRSEMLRLLKTLDEKTPVTYEERGML